VDDGHAPLLAPFRLDDPVRNPTVIADLTIADEPGFA
jgi:hypothetical protein